VQQATRFLPADTVSCKPLPGFAGSDPAMALGVQSHVAGLSLSNTVELLDSLGVQRSRKAIHDWVQKADLQPKSGKSSNQIALDETVIRINDE